VFPDAITKQLVSAVKKYFSIGLLLCLNNLPICAGASGILYNVDWPAIHLDGSFTVDIGSNFATYDSTFASGKYGGLNGTFNIAWTRVQFNVQPEFAELDFVWDQGFTGYAVTPSYVGRGSPWTSASEAWSDLITKGASDGVFITPVPEPASLATVAVGLLLLVLIRNRRYDRLASKQ
jgi:PEP-CTERM motif